MVSLINKLRIKAQEFFGNYKFHKYFNFLKESQFFKKEEILQIQQEKLQKLITYSIKNVKFFHEQFLKNNLKPLDFKTPEDLAQLPIMTKQLYKENFPDNVVDPHAKKKDLFLNSTSGSTGTPFKFYMSQIHRGHTAARVLRNQEWAYRKYGQLFLKIWGSTISGFKDRLFNKYIDNTLVLNAFDLSNTTIKKFYKQVLNKKPVLLEAYTSAAYIFALLMKKNDLFLNIPSAIISGETIYDFQLNLIRERFDTEIFNRYGCREFGALAQECSEHKGLHINQEDFIIEIVDDNDKPVKNGEKGRIIVTSLDNFSMPFIRYQMDDVGALSTKECNCGRELKMIKSIEGRVSDIIFAPSGRNISLFFFALIFEERSDYINEFQVIQNKKTEELILKLIPTENYNKKIEKEILEITKKMDDSFNISIELVDNIPLEPNGKKKYLKII